MSYDGFISYSHAADDLLAPRLQAGLQRFAKPWWQRRALRIFRDESSLSANPHLWSSITEALDESGWFVLLLSPDAAQSEWVNQEVAYWVAHKDPDRIIPVVTAGEFGWDGDVTGSAAPEALVEVLVEEPRWVDARGLGDPDRLDLKDPEFAAVVADLAAPLRGIPKDELASEEVRQHKRTVRTAWAAGIVVLVLAVAAAAFGVQSSRNADEAQRQAQIAEQNAESEAEARAEAESQRRVAEQALAGVAAEAARADRTADRLIDFILRPESPGGRGGLVAAPADPQLRAVTTGLERVQSPPASTRLDFQQVSCQGVEDTCFRAPAFVRDDPPAKTKYDLNGGTIWLADLPFHIRHGFEGRAWEDMTLALASGYSVHAYITKVVGPESAEFETGVSYRVDATKTIDSADPFCGPTLYPAGDPAACSQWLIDFPAGLPAGAYEIGLEWTAPCERWFETDVCPLAAKPVGLHFVGGIVLFASEDFQQFADTSFEWPFDPWSRSEPIPGGS